MLDLPESLASHFTVIRFLDLRARLRCYLLDDTPSPVCILYHCICTDHGSNDRLRPNVVLGRR